MNFPDVVGPCFSSPFRFPSCSFSLSAPSRGLSGFYTHSRVSSALSVDVCEHNPFPSVFAREKKRIAGSSPIKVRYKLEHSSTLSSLLDSSPEIFSTRKISPVARGETRSTRFQLRELVFTKMSVFFFFFLLILAEDGYGRNVGAPQRGCLSIPKRRLNFYRPHFGPASFREQLRFQPSISRIADTPENFDILENRGILTRADRGQIESRTNAESRLLGRGRVSFGRAILSTR